MNSDELNRKIIAYVGFAIKSGGVSYGLEKLKNPVAGARPALVLADNALSEKAKKEVAFFSAKGNIPLVRMDNLGDKLNKPNVKIISIINKSLAAQIWKRASSGEAEETDEFGKIKNKEETSGFKDAENKEELNEFGKIKNKKETNKFDNSKNKEKTSGFKYVENKKKTNEFGNIKNKKETNKFDNSKNEEKNKGNPKYIRNKNPK
jgi:ribosomal protein L7Ae-like RNA K-turn-binding protein